MKANRIFFIGTVSMVLILVCAVLITGCTSSSAPASPPQQSATATPVTTEQIIIQTPVSMVTTGSPVAMTTASLSNGVTITYPADWEKEETFETSMRDYGRITTNIANFYSPDISSARATHASPNVDTSKYTTLSIDVDPNPITDFENYFNQVTLALGNHYGHIDITKHNYQLKISPSDTFAGYKSYQMDFDTTNMRGSYILTNVDGTIYIFAFKNPSPYSAEVQDMYKSIQIVPVVSTDKHR